MPNGVSFAIKCNDMDLILCVKYIQGHNTGRGTFVYSPLGCSSRVKVGFRKGQVEEEATKGVVTSIMEFFKHLYAAPGTIIKSRYIVKLSR